MSMEVIMFRKVFVIAGACLLATSVLSSVPATAAAKITNGVACSKAGATTKVKGTTYKCAKSVLKTNSKLTWLSTDCIATSTSYRSANSKLPALKIDTDKIVEGLDAELANAAKLVTEFTEKVRVINVELTRLRADTANLTKNKATIDKYGEAVKNYETAIKFHTGIARKGGPTDSARTRALNQYQDAKDEIVASKDWATFICSKGF